MKEQQARPCDSSPSPSVAIIVLNWNGWQDTLKCIESVYQASYPNYLVILVDNGSCDDSIEKMKSWANARPLAFNLTEYAEAAAHDGGDAIAEDILDATFPDARMVLICNRHNLGFSGGCNVAIRYSLHRQHPVEYVLLLNNDSIIDKDCLVHLIRAAKETAAGIVGVGAMGEEGEQVQQGTKTSIFSHLCAPLTSNRLPAYVPRTDYQRSLSVSGNAMLINADVLRALERRRGEYFDSGLFLYGEDVELCITAGVEGYTSVIAREARVFSKEAGSSGGRFNPLVYYYSTRNRILLAARLLRLHRKLLFHIVIVLLSIGRICKMMAWRRYDSVRAICLGLVDGYKGTRGKWKYHDLEGLKWRGPTIPNNSSGNNKL